MLRWVRWASLGLISALGGLPIACSESAKTEKSRVPSSGEPEALEQALAKVVDTPSRDACPYVPGTVRCYAKLQTDSAGNVVAAASPRGYGPDELRQAYRVPSSGTRTGTIGIINAYDSPSAESDLATYREQYGLPPCTTENGCFKKVNQNGAPSPLPKSGHAGWASEIALDLDMASAMCPSCRLLLVLGNTPTLTDLGTAVNTAVRLGADVVSNSYGGVEAEEENDASPEEIRDADRLYFSNHPGVGIFAASGDWAYGHGTSYPASGKNVIGVGGTRLVRSLSLRGWAEVAWSQTGSGCSTRIAKPLWANDGDCPNKTVADVSAVSDPATGVAVYDTFGGGDAGWMVIGGTSAATPIVAAIFLMAGKASATGAFVWQNTSRFYDVTSGDNGSGTPEGGISCIAGENGSYLCNAKVGFDGPTGWGSPNTRALLEATIDDAGAVPIEDDAGPADSGTGTDASMVDANVVIPPLMDASFGPSKADASSAHGASSSTGYGGGNSGCSVSTGAGEHAPTAGVLFAMTGILAARRRRKLMR
ncbi:S8 family serine peptidase [Pendulispora brunnea]|uniref:S8 family serine peptidase n=1 Tax=Pendulispora brunnea TaxID=2905690 RepID=A0ABZ2KKN2_9BACT